MRKEFKRNIISALSFGLLEVLLLNSALRIDITELENVRIIQVVNAIAALVVAGLILRFIFYPYIVVDDKSVVINHNFTKDNFLISDIDNVDVDEGCFTLKSGRSIKFNSFMLGAKSAKSLKAVLRNLDLLNERFSSNP